MTEHPAKTETATGYLHHCLRSNCGYEWRSWLPRPATCPRCNDKYWDRLPRKYMRKKKPGNPA